MSMCQQEKEETEFKGQMIARSSHFYRIFSGTSYELFLGCTDHFFILYVLVQKFEQEMGMNQPIYSKSVGGMNHEVIAD